LLLEHVGRVQASIGLLLLENMKDALAYFETRPVSNQLTEKEASGFHH